VYSIVARILGRPIGLVALFDYIAQGIFNVAGMTIGIGTYVGSLNPHLPGNRVAAGTMVVVTLCALLRIHLNAILTGVFLALELSVVAILFLAGVMHPHQPLSILTHPVIATGGTLSPVATAAIVAALGTAVLSVNGYDSALNFSEETEGGRREIGKAVVIAASLGILFEMVPFVAGLFGARDLATVLHSATPLTDVVADAFGSTLMTVVTVGAIIAIFNASLAITLQFARIVWASGRDNAWPRPISQALGRVNRFGAPWVATLIVGGLSALLCLQSTLVSVVTFTAATTLLLYALTAVASLRSRLRDRSMYRPFRMPLWPLPPLLALAGVCIAMTQQTTADLWTAAAIVASAVAYYVFYVRSRSDRVWIAHEVKAEEPRKSSVRSDGPKRPQLSQRPLAETAKR